MMIENILEEYKKITEYIIQNIDNDYENLDKLMDKRQQLIDELFKESNIDVEAIKQIYILNGILELDKKLECTIKEKQETVKEEIKKIHKIKNANNAYEKNRKINNFFSIKI